jgi:hypothetical protein
LSALLRAIVFFLGGNFTPTNPLSPRVDERIS